MTHRCRKTMDKSDSAVSPVIGILLMLIVTIILAAVISAYTGGLATIQSKAPRIIIEASLANVTDDYSNYNESLDFVVTSIDGSVCSKDLKITTEWKDCCGRTYSKIVKPGENKYPKGYDPGSAVPLDFGNYTLVAGSRMNVNSSLSSPDILKSVINNWTSITDGTPVRIQFVHIPSGAVIVDDEIIAEV
jgi:flagellin-like protein